jgi:NADPH-dependent 7-cyano-7-deazaguanine reductase QueF
MDIDPPLSVSLSRPTFHALRLVARIDEIALEEIVETLVAAYLETRLRAIQAENTPRGVIDLSAWREERGAANASSRRSAQTTRRRSASQR